jgi:hypothetical protein
MFVMVELKVVKTGKKVRLSPHQVAFHVKHASIGCPTYILVEYNRHVSTGEKSQILLYEGSQAVELFERGVNLEPLAKWEKRKVQWHILKYLLTGGQPLD